MLVHTRTIAVYCMLFIFVKPTFVIILLQQDKIMVNGVRDVDTCNF